MLLIIQCLSLSLENIWVLNKYLLTNGILLTSPIMNIIRVIIIIPMFCLVNIHNNMTMGKTCII